MPRPRPYRTTGLECHPLHVSTPVIYARKGHPLRAATSLMDIRQAGWAVAGHAATTGNVIEEAHRVRKLPPPRILVQCADYMAATNLVAHTDLLCMIPHPALLQICQGMAIAPLRIREGLPRYEVCLFWRSAQPEESAASVQAVIAALTRLAPQD